jgi:L-asparaginase
MPAKTHLNPVIKTSGEVAKFASLAWPDTPRVLKISGPFALVHGGLGDQLDRPKDILNALLKIGRAIQPSLKKSALEISLKGAEQLELEPIFNAGFGSKMQRDGVQRMSAAVMDGAPQRMAAVSNLRCIKHPSKLAASLLNEYDRTLGGVEATRYAFRHGHLPEHLETEPRLKEWKASRESLYGTVGCIAFDCENKTAATTSTGGRGFETPGRVSDSCTPAGNFASPFGAVSCTGVGEQILEAAVASSIVTRLEDGLILEEAIRRLFIRHSPSNFGIIALDRMGRATVHATRGSMAFALVTSTGVHSGLVPQDWDKISEKL